MPGLDGIAAAAELARELQVMAGRRALDPGLATTAITEGTSPLTAREHDVLAAAITHSTAGWL
jgi:two-component system response regulator DesR